MHPGVHAATRPDHPAVIMAESGAAVSYSELDRRSKQLGQLLYAEGLRPGDGIALLLENHPRYFEVVWGALLSGLYITTVNRYLSAEEAAYIVDDCGAKVCISSRALEDLATKIPERAPGCSRFLMIDCDAQTVVKGFEPYEKAISEFAADEIPDAPIGDFMLYSSGTTGKPKGIRRPLSDQPASEGLQIGRALAGLIQLDEHSIYLSPAPLYHSAPIGFSTAVQAIGGTVVVMEHFDAVESLRAIEAHSVTHSQWVPTMFTRMLKLPAAKRLDFDLSSHQVAVHAAAPCPRQVKHEMMDWWGPILYEYYGGTETSIATFIGPEDWLAHPGSVGRGILCPLHICDEDGEELRAGEAGLIYIEMPTASFEYHNAPEKTRGSRHPQHSNWVELGDVGYVDKEGFLFLTDRASFMIISGGVNIYPQEIENELIVHPKIADVAVFGVPNKDFGEEVKAVVQPAANIEGNEALTDELMQFARERLAHYKCPRSIDYDAELPRLPTGKLYKRLLKDRYWSKGGSGILSE